MNDPVPGALEALRFLLSRYYVMILTAREPGEARGWLESHGFRTDSDNGSPGWSTRGVLLVTNRKLPAHIYVDDRGLRFWSWQQALPEIEFLLVGE